MSARHCKGSRTKKGLSMFRRRQIQARSQREELRQVKHIHLMHSNEFRLRLEHKKPFKIWERRPE